MHGGHGLHPQCPGVWCGKNEHEVEQMFRKVIEKCLDLKWTVQVMWKFHLIRNREQQRNMVSCVDYSLPNT